MSPIPTLFGACFAAYGLGMLVGWIDFTHRSVGFVPATPTVSKVMGLVFIGLGGYCFWVARKRP